MSVLHLFGRITFGQDQGLHLLCKATIVLGLWWGGA